MHSLMECHFPMYRKTLKKECLEEMTTESWHIDGTSLATPQKQSVFASEGRLETHPFRSSDRGKGSPERNCLEGN
jgi:hypothetical protein